MVPPDLVERVRAGFRAFLADDCSRDPPIDVEAERVEVAAPEVPEQPSAGGAAIIPIRQ